VYIVEGDLITVERVDRVSGGWDHDRCAPDLRRWSPHWWRSPCSRVAAVEPGRSPPAPRRTRSSWWPGRQAGRRSLTGWCRLRHPGSVPGVVTVTRTAIAVPPAGGHTCRRLGWLPAGP